MRLLLRSACCGWAWVCALARRCSGLSRPTALVSMRGKSSRPDETAEYYLTKAYRIELVQQSVPIRLEPLIECPEYPERPC